MCFKCKPLVNCPVGEKRWVVFEEPVQAETVDVYGRRLFIEPWVMFIDKWSRDQVDCGIHQQVYDENDVNYGGGFSLRHCPFCGEKLC